MPKIKNKVCWITPEHNVVGNALGYGTFNKKMHQYSKSILNIDENAHITLSLTPADHFTPIPGKFNVLYTMWEFMEIPESYIKALNQADAIIVPSRFCKEVFRKYTDKPIEICWLGVESHRFPYHPRRRPFGGNKFRFLWCGAPNPRKGYPLVLEAVKIIEKIPDIEIYIKTTVQKTNWRQAIRNIWTKRQQIFRDKGQRGVVWRWLKRLPLPGIENKVQVMGKHKNIIFDTRMLEFDELIKLYNDSHCFLFPTFGEGWGLTLCEAMATGMPSIATPVTGCADFFDDRVGYPIKYDIKTQRMSNYDIDARGHIPDTEDFIKQMMNVYRDYEKALNKGEKASVRMKTKFTWENSAKRLDEILTKYAEVAQCQ